MKTLGNLSREQLKINLKWLKILRANLFRQIWKREEQFELTREILRDSLKYVHGKARVIRVFNSFPSNFPVFVDEMKRRSELNYFLEHLLRKVSSLISLENKKREKFIQKYAEHIPAQVKDCAC